MTTLKCSRAHLRYPHPGHAWEPQPGVPPVHCPGYDGPRRTALEDLNAVPESSRWCCAGNAEDCPLCVEEGFDMLSYPWICPGHPDTEENRQRVQATSEPARCCVCGGGPVVQPFCQPCASCECAQNPCVRTGVGDPAVSESAEVERLRRMVRQLMTVNRATVGKLEAALARVEALAARVEAGDPVQDNADNLAAAIRDAARLDQSKETS